MSDYIGVIKLDKSIPCQKEVSGKTFKSKIAGHDILIIFPSIPAEYNPDQPDIQNGDLVVPNNLFKGQVKWGMINAWPSGLFSANALLCYASTDESGIREIYEDFPRWKEKLHKLNLIDTGNYLIPEQKLPAILVGGGFDDGFQVFEAEKGKPLRYIRNSRTVDHIQLRFVETKEAYTENKLEIIFQQAGSSNEISLAYELLITAYRAMERHDFRSAVILSGSAVEQAILKRLRPEYSSKRKFKQAKDKKPHRMLNGRFNWLVEKNIPIPVVDYKKTIIGVRNDAAHDGIRPSHAETKLCLEHCKTLVETYNPDVLET